MRLLLILALTAAFGMLLSALLPAAVPVTPHTSQHLLPVPGTYEAIPMPPFPLRDGALQEGCLHTHRAYTLIYPGPNASTCMQCGKRFAPGE
jgi:ABC-type multidrug transport system permease subunit